MDTLFIRGLQITTCIGALPFEQQMPQCIILDLDISTDCSKAAQTDNLEDTLNYADIAQSIKTFAKTQSFVLVEAFAEAVIKHLFAQYPIPALTISVTKQEIIPEVHGIGVRLSRTNESMVLKGAGAE